MLSFKTEVVGAKRDTANQKAYCFDYESIKLEGESFLDARLF